MVGTALGGDMTCQEVRLQNILVITTATSVKKHNGSNAHLLEQKGTNRSCNSWERETDFMISLLSSFKHERMTERLRCNITFNRCRQIKHVCKHNLLHSSFLTVLWDPSSRTQTLLILFCLLQALLPLYKISGLSTLRKVKTLIAFDVHASKSLLIIVWKRSPGTSSANVQRWMPLCCYFFPLCYSFGIYVLTVNRRPLLVLT